MSKTKKTAKEPVVVVKKRKVAAIKEPVVEVTSEVSHTDDVKQLVQRYIIADQTEIVNNAIANIDGFYNVEAIKNLPGDGLDNAKTHWILIWNDIALPLSNKGEVILYGKNGTWWHTIVDQDTNILNNAALIAIAKDVRDRMNQPKDEITENDK